MIWVFDSWLWGRITLEYLIQELPEYNYLYLWDTKNLPYGTKNPQFLQERTFECLEWMFAQWCTLVIIACNTASAYAIHPWQEKYPNRKVLSVTVPGVEAIITQWIHKPVLLATQSTVDSGIYASVIKRLFPEYVCTFIPVAWTGLVDRIERKIWTYELVQNILGTVRHKDYDAIVLGCTHYPLIIDEIQSIVGKWIPILNPGWESVQALRIYLERHTEIILQKNIWTSIIQYFVTWEAYELSVHIDL